MGVGENQNKGGNTVRVKTFIKRNRIAGARSCVQEGGSKGRESAREGG